MVILHFSTICRKKYELLQLWHSHFGHPNEEITKFGITKYSLPICNKSFKRCNSCIMEKMKCLPSPSRDINFAHSLLQIIYVDAWGPTSMPSIEGHWYYINFVDGFTIYNWLFPMFQNFDSILIFKKFKVLVEKQLKFPMLH